ncbi:hypothetical protein PPYR_00470 [Photinus pyralis]|uniref:Uncharacterized protein n=1 Tax=Photinus pyralis TaxID=7054 RepID=A0A5N4B285_PHOPY|nr:uncharacterized protein LOC116164450 [Photinus pyralis]KAB0803500.1 hypothetical protein PPYR_00470 [Photinus pyralis]
MNPEEIDGSNSIQQLACNAREMLLPSKSKTVYEAAYREYRRWYWGKKINCTTEDCILAYFNSELVSYKSSSLWSKYSMLRSTINLNEGVDISKFPSLIPYLKRKGEGHKAKKSLTLDRENVNTFLLKASNKEHLLKR